MPRVATSISAQVKKQHLDIKTEIIIFLTHIQSAYNKSC